MNPAAGTVLAVLLSLVSAAGYALAAVAQSRLAAASPAAPDGRGALRALLARGQWWWAVGLNAAGALAHVAALHYGPLTLVQPLGALTLVAALPLGAYRARRRVTRTEWRGALWTLAGLVGLVAVTGPAAPGEALSLRESLVVAAATALLIAVLASGRHHGNGGRAGRGLGHATASGIASGVASALTQTLTAALARDLPGTEPTWWQTALLAVLISGFATGGLLLSQAAYRGGLAAPLAVVNLSNPAAAAVIGVALLGETFRAGAWGWCAAAGASLIAARGVVLLTKGGGGGTGDAGTGGAAESGGAAGAGVVAGTGGGTGVGAAAGIGAVSGVGGLTAAGAFAETGGFAEIEIGGAARAGAVTGPVGRTGAGGLVAGGAVTGIAVRTGAGAAPEGNAVAGVAGGLPVARIAGLAAPEVEPAGVPLAG